MEVVEGGGEFGDGDAGSAEFSDHDAGGGIGQDSGIEKRSSGGNGKGEDAQHGIAGSGDVENLAAGGASLYAGLAHAGVGDFKTCGRNGDVARCRLLEDAHAFFAARDDHRATTEMRQ